MMLVNCPSQSNYTELMFVSERGKEKNAEYSKSEAVGS